MHSWNYDIIWCSYICLCDYYRALNDSRPGVCMHGGMEYIYYIYVRRYTLFLCHGVREIGHSTDSWIDLHRYNPRVGRYISIRGCFYNPGNLFSLFHFLSLFTTLLLYVRHLCIIWFYTFILLWKKFVRYIWIGKKQEKEEEEKNNSLKIDWCKYLFIFFVYLSMRFPLNKW